MDGRNRDPFWMGQVIDPPKTSLAVTSRGMVTHPRLYGGKA